MSRSRSSSVRNVDMGWHDIHRLPPEDYFTHPKAARTLYEQEIAAASFLEVEIGSGSGHFILKAAQKFPERQFVGIEYASRFLKLIRDRKNELDLKNIILISTDAQLFLRHGFPKDSVDILHVYFPDPWPKAKHHKKRSLSPPHLAEIARVLKPKGKLFFATDHDEYAKAARINIQQNPDLEMINDRTLTEKNFQEGSTYLAYGGQTQFGKKYLLQGKTVCALEVGKRTHA